MKAIVCVIFDKVGKQYTAPLCFNNNESGIRYFKRNCPSQGAISDFKMNRIGTYDDETGKLIAEEPTVLIDGESYGKDEQ